ncbi:MAG TPA: cupredoxin domain-containing protein [Thermoanaerobaculia bacterium]|nr:cupredoxin domain-containing protein [Thermoanaerobaculia bacterium]
MKRAHRNISGALAAFLLAGVVTAPPATAADSEEPKTIEITVTDKGYEPSRIKLTAGEPVRLAFLNEADMECAATVQSEALAIPKTKLPKGETTVIAIEPEKAGEYTFACGMGMFKGAVLVAAP